MERIVFPEFQTQHPTSLGFIYNIRQPASLSPDTSQQTKARAKRASHKALFSQEACFDNGPSTTNCQRHLIRHAANCLGRCCGCHCRHAQTCVPPKAEAQHTPYASPSPQLDSACGLTSPSSPTATIPCNTRCLQPTTAIPQYHPPAQCTISLYLGGNKTGSACRR
jgi:hypothetical protein